VSTVIYVWAVKDAEESLYSEKGPCSLELVKLHDVMVTGKGKVALARLEDLRGPGGTTTSFLTSALINFTPRQFPPVEEPPIPIG
jgi:hypothetical protein